MTIYAVGDIHGQLEQLKHVLARIENHGGRDAQVVFLGDYVDRGANSSAVISTLLEGLAAGRNWVCLKGNHDRMFEWFLEDTPRHDPHLMIGYHWLHEKLGGIETLKSYGVAVEDTARLWDVHERTLAVVPKDHADFLKNLAIHYQRGQNLFVHAGLRPEIPFADQTENDLLWIRQEFLTYTGAHPWVVVHGHTPAKQAEFLANRVNLDTGAGYGNELSVGVFSGTTRSLLK